MKEEIKNYGGCLPLADDSRDHSHCEKFGALGGSEIPLVDFDVDIPISVEDQKDSDLCTGYSSAEMNGDLQNEDFCPLYQFAKIKQVRGEWKGWGADLRDACKALQKFGSLPKRFSPYTYKEGKPTDRTRDFLANWENWPKELDDIAAQYKIGEYLRVDGPGDFFDNIRSTLWIHRDEDKSVLAGLLWDGGWDTAIIPESNGEYTGSGHAMKHQGQRIINNKPYLKTQNSYGLERGDGGFNYFPRSVINQNERYGAFYITTLEETLAIKVSILKVIKSLYETIIALLKNSKVGSKLGSFFGLPTLSDWLKPKPLTLPRVAPSSPIVEPQYDWSTPERARHSVRVICDEEGLNLSEKNLICRVIRAESGFKNTATNKNKNYYGEVTSTDYGLCQINDWYHCGPNKTFPSVQWVLDNPDKVVRWMIKQYRKGNLRWWIAYRNGSYRNQQP